MSINSEFENALANEERINEQIMADIQRIKEDIEDSARYRRFFFGLFLMSMGFLAMYFSPLEKDIYFYPSVAVVLIGLSVFSTGLFYSPYESKDEYEMSMFGDQLDGDDF